MVRRLLFTALSSLGLLSAMAQEEGSSCSVRIFDGALFYDGYMLENNPDKELEDGILRHSCSLYSVRMTDEQLDRIGTGLKMNVFVQACCDNYDRIGNINIALVPKGAEKYSVDEVERFEIGRFITPFMDKNKEPDTVPYSYDVTYLSAILRDKDFRAAYDLWLEFELFGVPYAANEQVAGCAGRSDVFKGTLEFETSAEPAPPTEGNILIPIVMKKPEYIGANLNNYKEEATDTIGKTVKTYTFDVPQDVTGGQIVLITSNHGANSGGEEYNRRWHYVYVDDELVLNYKPGRDSCEPFRQYNTQPNGIYWYFPRTDEDWQSFSNWCPGDVIDNRLIWLGDVKKGEHKIRISVPDAVFANKQGDIPVSIYFHAATKGVDDAGIELPVEKPSRVGVSVADGLMEVSADVDILTVELYSVNGECLLRRNSSAHIPVDGFTTGVYLVNVYLADGVIVTRKVMLP